MMVCALGHLLLIMALITFCAVYSGTAMATSKSFLHVWILLIHGFLVIYIESSFLKRDNIPMLWYKLRQQYTYCIAVGLPSQIS